MDTKDGNFQSGISHINQRILSSCLRWRKIKYTGTTDGKSLLLLLKVIGQNVLHLLNGIYKSIIYIKKRKDESFCCRTADEYPGGV